MNILFLSQENPYPPDGGHYIRTFNTLKLLARKHKIFFIATADNDWRSRFKYGLESLCETIDIFILPYRTSTFRFLWSLFLNLFSPLPYSVFKNYSKEVSGKIKQVMTEKNIDFVHVDILPLAIYYYEFKHLPKVLVNHNVESLRLYRWMKIEKNIFKKLYLYIQYLKLARFEKTMCPKFDRCVVVSEDDRQVLKKLCAFDNFVLLPNGVDIHYYQAQEAGKMIDHRLIWVGGMRFAYNADAVDYFLEEIFPLIQVRIPEVKVSFIGNFPTPKLLKWARNNKSVIVHGYIDDIRPYMQEATVFIAPIRIGSGTKLKVLNAMAMEKAVITTTVGAEGIKATPGEDLLIADSPLEFAEKTVFLLQHPEIVRKIGKNAREVIEEYYDWEVIGKKMHELYEDVVGEKISASPVKY